MSRRRAFIQQLTAAASLSIAAPLRALGAPQQSPLPDGRDYWVSRLKQVAEPVLAHMAENELKQSMPVEASGARSEGRRPFTHLEALGRTLTGLAPWLELADHPAGEAEAATHLRNLARRSIGNAVAAQGPDSINFTAGSQILVDSAFLCHAMLRAPRELWQKLEPGTQQRVIDCLHTTRRFRPGANNWLLFAAMIEAFLGSVKAEWREQPIQNALDSHEQWYKGDGVYGDGADLHWDYYNSFVIHPMLIDVLETIGRVTSKWSDRLPRIVARARRYAVIQERLIAPDGSYPAIGRSICYRCGAFQLLAQMALRKQLPATVSAGQVRSALSAVIHRTLDAPGTFDRGGWLQIGLAGHQPGLAEGYISTGSLYLCCAVFLPLGLPAADPFWSDPPADWTARKLWAGRDGPSDHAV